MNSLTSAPQTIHYKHLFPNANSCIPEEVCYTILNNLPSEDLPMMQELSKNWQQYIVQDQQLCLKVFTYKLLKASKMLAKDCPPSQAASIFAKIIKFESKLDVHASLQTFENINQTEIKNDPHFVSKMVIHHFKQGNYFEAKQFASKLDNGLNLLVLQAISKMGLNSLLLACQVFELPSVHETNYCWTVEADLKKGKISRAIQALDQIKSQQYKVNALQNIAIAHAKAGDFSQAIKNANAISDSFVQKRTKDFIYIEKIKAAALSNDYDAVNHALQELSCLHFNYMAYYELSKIEASKGRFEFALQIAKKIREGDDLHDKAISQIAHIQAIRGYLSPARKTILLQANEDQKLTQIGILAAMLGQYQGAFKAILAIESPKDRLKGLLKIAKYHPSKQIFEAIKSILSQIGSRNLAPFESYLGKFVALQLKAGDLSGAVQSLQSIDEKLKLGTYLEVISRLNK